MKNPAAKTSNAAATRSSEAHPVMQKVHRKHAFNLTHRRAREGQGETPEIYTVSYTVPHFRIISRIESVTYCLDQGTQNPAAFGS